MAQLVALLLLAPAALGGARARPFKAAIWLVLVYSVEMNTMVCADIFRVWAGADPLAAGLEAATQVLFGGLVAWAACTWGAVFAGSAAAWDARHAGDEECGCEGEAAPAGGKVDI